MYNTPNSATFDECARYRNAKCIFLTYCRIFSWLCGLPLAMQTVNILCCYGLTGSRERIHWIKAFHCCRTSPIHSEPNTFLKKPASIFPSFFTGRVFKKFFRDGRMELYHPILLSASGEITSQRTKGSSSYKICPFEIFVVFWSRYVHVVKILRHIHMDIV